MPIVAESNGTESVCDAEVIEEIAEKTVAALISCSLGSDFMNICSWANEHMFPCPMNICYLPHEHIVRRHFSATAQM